MLDLVTVQKLKAYRVHTDDYGCVVFSEHAVVARRIGANELDVEFGDILSCFRAPHFDHLAPGPIPNTILFQAGWHFYCAVCDGLAYADSGGVERDGQFYCTDHAASENVPPP